jgi:hypothetical protein
MRSLLTLGLVFFALSFFGLTDKLKELSGSSNTPASNSTSSNSSSSTTGVEKAKMSAAQQAIADGGTETKWDDQGLSWRLPSGWKKMDVKKESFNYQSPDNAFLLVNISSCPTAFRWTRA